MNYNNTDSPSSSRQESFEGFTPPFAHGSHENCRKKRTKVVHIADPIWRHSNSSFKLKQRKKPEPGAPKITRPCSECGKQFWSWKALFGHMRCHPERQWRGINPPPNFRSMLLETPAVGLREKFTEEDHEVATCLVMLSNGPTVIDVDRGQPESGDSIGESLVAGDVDRTIPSGLNCRFECSSCKRVFGSHQALGGHRATHKNVKGCFAIARNDGEDEDRNCGHRIDTGGEEEMKETGEEKALILVHKCSICLRVFSSGQALGGHMRCHWEKGYEPSLQGLNPSITREGCVLDLNMPASVENDESSSSSGLALDFRLGI